jgi:hypothetical protein
MSDEWQMAGHRKEIWLAVGGGVALLVLVWFQDVMKFICPNCQVKIYSRAHRVCHSCGVALPPEFLLPALVIRSTDEKAKRELRKNLKLIIEKG